MSIPVRLSLGLLLVCAVGLIVRAGIGIHAHPHPRIVLTLLASLALLIGAAAGLRGHVWGVLLTSGTAIAFGGVVAFGVAPGWFVGVAALGGVPLLQVTAPLYRRDPAAFVACALLALGVGVGAAVIGGPGVSWLTGA